MGNYLMQMVMGCLGVLGFSVLFNIRGRKLPVILIATALSWVGYMLCDMGGTGPFLAVFCGTVIAGMISEIMARVVKAPVIMLLVPTLVPLIPGGKLYYMMSNLVRGYNGSCLIYARQLLEEAGAIALGIICCTSVMGIITGLQNKLKTAEKA